MCVLGDYNSKKTRNLIDTSHLSSPFNSVYSSLQTVEIRNRSVTSPLYTMPYIIIRSVLDPTAGLSAKAFNFPGSGTAIEYHVGAFEQGERSKLAQVIRSLGAKHDPASDYCTSVTGQRPHFVLNRLETEGYKVVGTNTVSTHLVWTVHKQA